MTIREADSRWNDLLTLARRHMESVGMSRSDWTWGGGTVLMLRHKHRLSWDVDLFVNDVQLLSYLSPRLNDNVAADVDGYNEQSNHLRCFIDGVGEIDYLTAQPVIDFKPEKMDVPGHGPLQVMSDREILAQKIHYRGHGFTGRDLFDFATITALRPELLEDAALQEIGFGRKAPLDARLSSDILKQDYSTVRLHEASTVSLSFEDAREAMQAWLDGTGPSIQRRPAPPSSGPSM